MYSEMYSRSNSKSLSFKNAANKLRKQFSSNRDSHVAPADSFYNELLKHSDSQKNPLYHEMHLVSGATNRPNDSSATPKGIYCKISSLRI